MHDSYENYFRKHFGSKFDPAEIDIHANFLKTQFAYMCRKAGIKKLSEKRVLEVGSGLGSFAKILLESGVRDYVGLDLDPEAVEFTNKNLGDHFLTRSVEEFDPGDKKYNYVFALEVLEHFSDPFAGLSSMYKVLEKNGLIIATTPYPFEKNILSDKTHHFVLHPLGWKKMMKEIGFKTVETYPMSFFPYLWRIHPSLNVVIPFYVPLKYWVSTSLILARK